MFGVNYFGQPYFSQGYGNTYLGDSVGAGQPRPASFLDIPRDLRTREDKPTGLPKELKATGSIENVLPSGVNTEIKPSGGIENLVPFDVKTRDIISGEIKETKPAGNSFDVKPSITTESKSSDTIIHELDKPTLV